MMMFVYIICRKNFLIISYSYLVLLQVLYSCAGCGIAYKHGLNVESDRNRLRNGMGYF